MKIIYTALSISLITVSSACFARTPEALKSPDDGTGFVGVSVLVNSEYLGSADEDVTILPYLSFQNVKGFDLTGTTLSYRLIEAGTGQGFGKWSLRAGPAVSYQGDRDSSDSPNLNGFEDVDFSIPLGGYVRTTIGPVGFVLQGGQDIAGGHDGLTIDASVGTFYRSGSFAIQPFAALHWSDDKHHDSFFSVNSAQSNTSGLDIFNANSGIYAYSANVLSWVEITDKLAISLFASYREFTGDAKDSPIINATDGSDNEIFAAISLSRMFDTKKW